MKNPWYFGCRIYSGNLSYLGLLKNHVPYSASPLFGWLHHHSLVLQSPIGDSQIYPVRNLHRNQVSVQTPTPNFASKPPAPTIPISAAPPARVSPSSPAAAARAGPPLPVAASTAWSTQRRPRAADRGAAGRNLRLERTGDNWGYIYIIYIIYIYTYLIIYVT